MQLYYHMTDGGAEYLTTQKHDISTSVLRTDGDELEIFNLEQLKNCGFKSVILPDGTKMNL